MKNITQNQFKELLSNHQSKIQRSFYFPNHFELTNVDLSNIDFSVLSSDDYDTLSGAVFYNCCLANLKLNNRNFSDTKFYECDLRGVKLLSASLARSILHDCNLEGAILCYCNLEDAELSKSIFSNANLNGCKMSNVRAYETIFDNSKMVAVNFSGAYLSDSSFKGCNLYRAIFDCMTTLPENFYHIIGYAYPITINGNDIQVGCRNYTYEEWLTKSKTELFDMDGYKAVSFYPTLLKIIKFYFEK